jgi:hypothetical protein
MRTLWGILERRKVRPRGGRAALADSGRDCWRCLGGFHLLFPPTSRPHGRPTRAPAPASLPPSVQACSAARYCRRQSPPARVLLHTQQVDVTFVSLGTSQ